MPVTYPVSYTTYASITKIMSRIDSASNINSEDLAFLQGKAEAYVLGKIGRVYPVPFVGVNIPLVQHLCEDMSIYYIGRRFFVDQARSVSEWVTDFKENVDETLTEIMSGNLPLKTDSGDTVALPANMLYSDTKNYAPTFDHRDETEQRIDSDRLEDEESEAE